MDYNKIYNEALESQKELESNTEEKLDDTLETEKKPAPIEEKKDPKELWGIAKSNVESIEKEYESLLRNPAIDRLSRIDAGFLRTFKGLGNAIVGVSSVLGGLLKLGNALIPGFGLISVPSSYLLGGSRLAGQALIDKGSPIKPISRIAPSSKQEK